MVLIKQHTQVANNLFSSHFRDFELYLYLYWKFDLIIRIQKTLLGTVFFFNTAIPLMTNNKELLRDFKKPMMVGQENLFLQ